MLALFALRLALGLLAALWLLPAAQIPPRFYRTHFLIALGLGALAFFLLRDTTEGWLFATLIAALGLSFLGALVWSIEGAPGGRALVLLTPCTLGLVLVLLPATRPLAPALSEHATVWRLADDLTSSALLGLALTTMLLGHFYLISPGMSLAPLLRLLRGLFVALAVRAIVASVALGFWVAGRSAFSWTEVAVLWLPLRWGLGLVGPGILGWMAWQSARIRSTQSATGILYIVVVFCFLGELTGLLLRSETGYAL